MALQPILQQDFLYLLRAIWFLRLAQLDVLEIMPEALPLPPRAESSALLSPVKPSISLYNEILWIKNYLHFHLALH